ncbi:MAG: hypothetical protein A4E53_02356 [Pelotomaculum sp. PtaB.Bin104]|nr:MAG: hypothetical protein A4E53_02356 [Pelotomaculum sp. PtaB.Bin104]
MFQYIFLAILIILFFISGYFIFIVTIINKTIFLLIFRYYNLIFITVNLNTTFTGTIESILFAFIPFKILSCCRILNTAFCAYLCFRNKTTFRKVVVFRCLVILVWESARIHLIASRLIRPELSHRYIIPCSLTNIHAQLTPHTPYKVFK